MEDTGPYKKGHLAVGQGHQLYYELWGNPKGKPVLYVHGGPGAGFSQHAHEYFDPKLWNIILFEQRGAGRSTPFASLAHNTTDYLVEDMHKVLDFVGVKSTMLFGGSWGSTLSLVYAIRNPERVSGMILRGIYLPSKKDNTYMFAGGISLFAPKEWERFIRLVPKNKRDTAAFYYYQQMQSKDEKVKAKYTYEWAYFELSIMKMHMSKKAIQEGLTEYNYQSLSPLEAHYLTQQCFLPENYILDNAHLLKKIPILIIQGKQDLVCPPYMAYSLHKKLPQSKLYFVVGGHSSSEKAIRRKLFWAVKKMAESINS